MSEETTFIYGLVDPIARKVRYIGKSNNPKQRVREHIRDEKVCKRSKWISELKTAGVEPRLVIIEEVARDDWQAAEIFWIACFRNAGADLVNFSDGGDGPPDRSESFKERMRVIQTGRVKSPETRAKISAANRGKKRSAETRARNRASCSMKNSEVAAKVSAALMGHKHSDETKKKIAEKARGRVASAETREKFSIARTGKKHSEETRAKCRAAAAKRRRNPITGRMLRNEDQNEV